MSGILLAGGRGRRMGRDKAFIEIAGERVVERLVRVLRDSADEVLIVGHDPARFAGLGVRVVPDEVAGLGVVGGIITGLSAMKGQIGIVLGCDMPFVTPALIRHVLGAVDASEGAIVRTAHGYEPLCAAYRATALPTLRAMAEEGDLAARHIPNRVRMRTIEGWELEALGFDDRLLFNMNTPDDLSVAERIARDLMATS